MPFSLLIALFLGFGLETTAADSPLPSEAVPQRIGETLGVVAMVAVASFVLGRRVASRVARDGGANGRLRRKYAWGTRSLEILTLAAYGTIAHEINWIGVVRSGLGLNGIPVLADALILLPYLLMQLAAWWGLFPAEQALRSSFAPGGGRGIGRYLVLRARQSLGLILPAMLLFTVGEDIARRIWPGWNTAWWSQPVEVAAMGLMIVVLSPLFVRLAWPTRPLEPGPLRDRLEHLSARFGFRYSDILVWDTGHAVINAGVTGSVPWFRYVILSDALVDYMEPIEIAAVFGHEVGHIAHRHMLYFGFFFVTSLGALAPLGKGVEDVLGGWLGGAGFPIFSTVVETAAALLLFAAYFVIVFGHVSRRFERQADLFGCRAVSCGLAECPPHADLDRMTERGPVAGYPCPAGIRIFANALASVATLNGIETRARSWRHGSIARRIAFLEGLEGRPGEVTRFQANVYRMRVGLAVFLTIALVTALATSSIGAL